MLIGYARVSTRDQKLELQVGVLTKGSYRNMVSLQRVSRFISRQPLLKTARTPLRTPEPVKRHG